MSLVSTDWADADVRTGARPVGSFGGPSADQIAKPVRVESGAGVEADPDRARRAGLIRQGYPVAGVRRAVGEGRLVDRDDLVAGAAFKREDVLEPNTEARLCDFGVQLLPYVAGERGAAALAELDAAAQGPVDVLPLTGSQPVCSSSAPSGRRITPTARQRARGPTTGSTSRSSPVKPASFAREYPPHPTSRDRPAGVGAPSRSPVRVRPRLAPAGVAHAAA